MPFVNASLLHPYKAFLAKLSQRGDASRRPRRSSKLLRRLRAKALLTTVDPLRAFRRLGTALETWTKGVRPLGIHHGFLKLPNTRLKNGGELQEMFGHEGMIRTGLILALAGMSKVFMFIGNETIIHGSEHLEQALHREEGQPLITVSNHVGAIDDPLVISTLVPTSAIFQSSNVRWTLCATDRCFVHPTASMFFKATKVLPIERGAGLHQLGMRAAEHRLNQGDWVHIFPGQNGTLHPSHSAHALNNHSNQFLIAKTNVHHGVVSAASGYLLALPLWSMLTQLPCLVEGTRSRKGELLPLRMGIGKLVANCDRLPLVVPFVHSGMQAVMPSGSILPKTGNKIRVLVGEPISFVDVIRMAEESGWTDTELYTAITQKIGATSIRF